MVAAGRAADADEGGLDRAGIGIYSTICRMLSMERQLRSARRLSFTKALEMVGQRGEHMVASFLDTQLLPSLSFTFLSISWFFLAKGFPMRVLVSQAAYVLHVVLTCPGLELVLSFTSSSPFRRSSSFPSRRRRLRTRIVHPSGSRTLLCRHPK